MKNLLRKIHPSAALALLGQLVGVSDLIASNPKAAELAVLPHIGLSPEWAAALVAVCTAVQALSRAIHKGDVQEIPKGRF